MSCAPDTSEFTKEEIIETLNEVRLPYDVAVFSSENYFNMGSILRTGHGFLCNRFWMVDFDKFYKKSTMGTYKWENVEKVTMAEFLERNSHRPIVAFERRLDLDMKNIYSFEYPENPILFFGSEKFGVPNEVINVAHSIVTIPLYGIHNDLNLAVASGIAMNDFVSKFLYK